MATADVRASFDAHQWKEWESPEDNGSNPAQLRRIVREWAELKEVMGELKTVNPDPRKALGTLLAHHAIVERSTFVVSSAPVAAAPKDDFEDDDFEDNTDDF